MHEKLFMEMVRYDQNDPKRIQHFTKVHAYAHLIGLQEGLSEKEQMIVEAAAIVHDIGIRASERIYGDCSGKHQEELGPFLAKDMLLKLGYEQDVIERICYLVGHHHTYNDIQGMDYQILVEADFLVNLYEDNIPNAGIANAYAKIFKTKTGKDLCEKMFGLNQ
jgi:hypothetical protein